MPELQPANLHCPACKRYIGLWSRNGELVGHEWHNARRFEEAIHIPSLKGLAWEVRHLWVCDYGRK
jgi:hypothetical protein